MVTSCRFLTDKRLSKRLPVQSQQKKTLEKGMTYLKVGHRSSAFIVTLNR